MTTLEVHPEIHVRELRERPAFATCHECHRTFRPKSEDQLSLALCDDCYDAVRCQAEPEISVHVKVRPHHVENL